MADPLPAHPLTHPYGGRGPLILGLIWTEASIALILMLMRTYTNAFVVKFFKWDYLWAMLALVGTTSETQDFKSIMNNVGHRHDHPGHINSICHFGNGQSYLASGAAANSEICEMVLDRSVLGHSIHRLWKVCRHCLYSAHLRSSAKPEDDVVNLFPLLHWCFQFLHQHYRNEYDPNFMLAYRQILELSAPGKLQPCRPHQSRRILSRLYNFDFSMYKSIALTILQLGLPSVMFC